MSKILCYSVRLESLVRISDKAYRACGFDGSTDIIPASQVFGRDYDVMKSDAYWISAWILSKKNVQYSGKKSAWFDSDTGMKSIVKEVRHHVPEKLESQEQKPDESLIR